MRGPSFEAVAGATAPQDDGLLFFDVFFFLTAGLFLAAARFGAAFAALRILGRLSNAARCAAASAALA